VGVLVSLPLSSAIPVSEFALAASGARRMRGTACARIGLRARRFEVRLDIS
jgi:hypothetical protein